MLTITEKIRILERIMDSGLVAVVRAEDSDQAFKIAEAGIQGGVAAIEITFTVPRAARVIEDLARKFKSDEIIIGAGTVLDPETARIAILAGAHYVVNTTTTSKAPRRESAMRASRPGGLQTVQLFECVPSGQKLLDSP